METYLETWAFAGLVILHVAAVIALHAMKPPAPSAGKFVRFAPCEGAVAGEARS